MNIRKILFIVVLLVMLFFSLAFQVEDPNPWRGIFEWAIGIIVMLLGAPITQWIKNALEVKGKVAFLITACVAVAVALAELFLSNVLSFSSFSLENFPIAFAVVMTVATVYYNLLKGTDSILGNKLLLPNS